MGAAPPAGDVCTAVLAKYARLATSGDRRLAHLEALGYKGLTKVVDAKVAEGS